jgi:cyclase
MKRITILLCCCAQLAFGQTTPSDSITVRITPINGNLYFLDCLHGFGGGNVIASIGDDGVLLVDDMFAFMSVRMEAAIRSIRDKPIRVILNTHFHSDHIDGNKTFSDRAVIIGQDNVARRLLAHKSPGAPSVTFADSLTIRWNGENVRMMHYPHCHTDGDAVIYFTQSRVMHLGDMFFFEMFPAVYTEGGGDIRQLIVVLDRIVKEYPADTRVVPGHGNIATMKELGDYVAMLKETTDIVTGGIRAGRTLEEMKKAKVLAKYDKLGAGGAQTTDEYLAMLYKLLSVSL